MEMPGCTWVKAIRFGKPSRVTHIFRGGATLCGRRFKDVKTIRELDPKLLVIYSPEDCYNCLAIFNQLLTEKT